MCNWADAIEERGLIKGREEGVEQNKIENALRMIAGGKRYTIHWVDRRPSQEGSDVEAILNGFVSIGIVNNIF